MNAPRKENTILFGGDLFSFPVAIAPSSPASASFSFSAACIAEVRRDLAWLVNWEDGMLRPESNEADPRPYAKRDRFLSGDSDRIGVCQSITAVKDTLVRDKTRKRVPT
jgi:hypothetical protein